MTTPTPPPNTNEQRQAHTERCGPAADADKRGTRRDYASIDYDIEGMH